MRQRFRYLWALLILAALSQCGRVAVAQAPTMEPFERVLCCPKPATARTPLTSKWAKDRAESIAKCEAIGGIPVPRAGVISSEGIGCAKPADED